jgi:hypothetical protein
MNKLIQSIIISAVVIAPLSSLGLIADATMHHTESHVSTLSLETTRTRRKTKKVKKVKKIRKQANVKAKKQVIKRYKKKPVSSDEKPSAPETMTPTPEKSSQPGTPQTIPVPPSLPTPSTSPESSTPTTPLNSTLDPKSGNPMANPSGDMALPNPAAGTPTIPVFSPGSIANPNRDTSIPNPKLPNVLPTGLVK